MSATDPPKPDVPLLTIPGTAFQPAASDAVVPKRRRTWIRVALGVAVATGLGWFALVPGGSTAPQISQTPAANESHTDRRLQTVSHEHSPARPRVILDLSDPSEAAEAPELRQAVHFADYDQHRTRVEQVGNRVVSPETESGAWLTGHIETVDAPAPPLPSSTVHNVPSRSRTR